MYLFYAKVNLYMFCIHINVYNSTKVRHLNFIFKMKTYACTLYTYVFALYYTIAIIIALQVIFFLIRHPLSLFTKNNRELITKTENDN